MKHSFFLPPLLMLFAGSAAFPSEKASDLTFEQHVRPIFKAHCFECHGEGEKLKGGLDLRLRRLLVQGGKSGPALVPSKRGQSLLFQRIATGEMPPGKKKLSADEVALIGRWIDAEAKTAGSEPADLAAGLHITTEEKAFWAYQPITRPAVPAIKHSELKRSAIDAFLLARLEEQGLSFAAEADRATLVRRISFDLIGLPPTPDELAAALADRSPDWYEKIVDRLLASPQYGERWARHWLDVAGYADSDGYASEDTPRPYAYKYRDYVIRSFNADKPLDRFIQEQLAGDEMVQLPYADLAPEDVDKLIATGFLRMAPDGTASSNVEPGLARNQVIADTLKIVSTSLLGLTVACAQCHNHRYDPIPQTDYYQLRAIFEPALDWKSWRTPAQRLLSLASPQDRAKAKQIEAEAVQLDRERLQKQEQYINQVFERELAKLPEDLRGPITRARDTPVARQTPEQKKLLRDHPSVNVTAGSLYLYDRKMADELKACADKAAAVRATKPVEEFVAALTEVPQQVPATYLFNRGDHEQPRQAIEPGGLTILDDKHRLQVPSPDAKAPTTGRRLAFARWLTDGKHPLTARVLANRIWLHHFGRGIVGTPADFGVLGERPTHPELLDWLASELMDSGWRLKHFHKLIVTSTAYRQSSRRDPAKDRLDPDNRLLGRMPVRRLEAEVIRDAMLAVSGRLNPKPFGPAVPVRADEVGQIVIGVDTADTAGRPTGKVVPLNGEEFRRSIYVQVRRSRPLSALEAFDAPVLEPNCEIRNASTVAPQALLLMNSQAVIAEAEAFAARIRREAGDDDLRTQVVRSWRLTFSREPTTSEIDTALVFLAEQQENFQKKSAGGKNDPRQLALASFCQALLSANAFLYVD